jgi:glyoxylase-like metal-dependent hydrolase (beta-lactamase superfamily II)
MNKMIPKMSAPKAYVLLMSAILTSLLIQSNPAAAAAPQVRTQAPGFYRMILGDFEITALLDGTHPFPAAEVLTTTNPGSSSGRARLFEKNLKEANDLLAAADVTAPTEGSINAFLVNTGTKLILIDSGAGTLYGSCCGHLIDNLRASGYQPERVDEVLLTHLHADHVGGIAPGGAIAFPNAIIRSSKIDADYWLNDTNENAAQAFLRPMFEGDKASLKPLPAVLRRSGDRAGDPRHFGSRTYAGPHVLLYREPGTEASGLGRHRPRGPDSISGSLRYGQVRQQRGPGCERARADLRRRGKATLLDRCRPHFFSGSGPYRETNGSIYLDSERIHDTHVSTRAVTLIAIFKSSYRWTAASRSDRSSQDRF